MLACKYRAVESHGIKWQSQPALGDAGLLGIVPLSSGAFATRHGSACLCTNLPPQGVLFQPLHTHGISMASQGDIVSAIAWTVVSRAVVGAWRCRSAGISWHCRHRIRLPLQPAIAHTHTPDLHDTAASADRGTGRIAGSAGPPSPGLVGDACCLLCRPGFLGSLLAV